jgi:hypothetical protein
MRDVSPCPPLGTCVWLRRNEQDESPEDSRLHAAGPDCQAAFEQASTQANGGSVTLVAREAALRAIVAGALGIAEDASASLIVAPGKAVLLQVGKLGWMLVHSNSRMPDDA